ncbi:MAG: GNAT family N-acetyltransferase [Sutterella sp.]|nr:GNAT family N-acetyltransferase [Sutterella sp.]
MAFSIRPCTLADLDALTEIEEKSFPPEEKASRERFKERLASFGDCFLILEDDGKPVGLIDGMVTNSEVIEDPMFENATLHNPQGVIQSVFGLCVLPEYRRRGGAAMLMEAFIEKAKREGRKAVILTCKERLIPYYSKFGFENKGVSGSVHGGAQWYDMILWL